VVPCGAPKQRMMLFESGLHTTLPLPFQFPTQQFWDAFTLRSPLPPQMLPGGLQLWPPVQVWSFFDPESNSGGVAFFAGPSQ